MKQKTKNKTKSKKISIIGFVFEAALSTVNLFIPQTVAARALYNIILKGAKLLSKNTTTPLGDEGVKILERVLDGKKLKIVKKIVK